MTDLKSNYLYNIAVFKTIKLCANKTIHVSNT